MWRPAAWVLLVGGLLGEAAALILTVEKYRLALDPGYITSCDLNPVLSCGSIMTTPQASAFGIPNSLLGVAGFAVVATVGAALLAGARTANWFWAGLQIGVTAGFLFVHWLIWQSLSVIGALCPYCMLVWVVTATVFWYVTLASIDRWARTPRRQRLAATFRSYQSVPVVAWIAAVIVLIVVRFWEYWRTLL
ncbi:MAG: vitamin K epoxide reductase family protein [Nakamurella multipartita]